jgi:hypothetical protein
MGAFVTNIVDDAEFPASGERTAGTKSKKMSASCFYSELVANNRQINDQTMRMVFREKKGGATMISTIMGLEESSEFTCRIRYAYLSLSSCLSTFCNSF